MIKVKINTDEVSATDEKGNVYKINGIVIVKPDEKERFYSIETTFCKACIYKGHEVSAKKTTENTIDIY